MACSTKWKTLIQSLAGVGHDIAHDLRTPLTRARLILERGRDHATTLQQLQAVADKTIEALDQSLSIITAILRLAEIEKSQRSAGFGEVALADLIREVGDMYEPIAEDKGISLVVQSPHELNVHGDRDLLIEAVANLVDNAVKFTPVGGRVEIGLLRSDDETIVRVKDTGSGISEHERDAVLRRFYRSDKIRHTSGLGLGLNLVAAIVKVARIPVHHSSRGRLHRRDRMPACADAGVDAGFRQNRVTSGSFAKTSVLSSRI